MFISENRPQASGIWIQNPIVVWLRGCFKINFTFGGRSVHLAYYVYHLWLILVIFNSLNIQVKFEWQYFTNHIVNK